MTTAIAFQKAEATWIAMDASVTEDNIRIPVKRKNWLIEHSDYIMAVSGVVNVIHAIERLVRKNEVEKVESYFPDRIEDFEKELKELKSKSEAKSEDQEIILKTIPRDEALKLIKKYIDKNPGCRTSDIIINLEIDPDLVLDVIRTLRQRGEIRSEKIE